jgi:hypothetical protein
MNQEDSVGPMNKTVPEFIKKKQDYINRYNQELLDIQKNKELKEKEFKIL